MGTRSRPRAPIGGAGDGALDGQYAPSLETAPPRHPSALGRVKAGVSGAISATLLPCVQRFAGNYLGGETVDDAIGVARRLALQGSASTLGFWNTADYPGREVVDIYLATIARLRASDLDSSVSMKAPAIRFDPVATREIAAAAAAQNIRLHFDSHGPETVEATHAVLEAVREQMGAARLGTTLPGRWLRSAADAEWAIERGLSVRVVKGQWPDPADPQRNMRAGFLDLIDRLAGRAPHVGVATHDLPLAAQAIARLRAAGTPCELEQLLGMTTVRSLALARADSVGVRVYVPFGRGYVPNAVGALRRDPRLAWMVVKTLIRPWRRPA